METTFDPAMSEWGNPIRVIPDDYTPPTQPEQIPEEKPEEDEEEMPVKLNSVQIKELNLWRQISERNERKGKGRACDFECKYLTPAMADLIREKLRSGMSIAEAFEIGGHDTPRYDSDGLYVLAEAINKAAEVELQKTTEKA